MDALSIAMPAQLFPSSIKRLDSSTQSDPARVWSKGSMHLSLRCASRDQRIPFAGLRWRRLQRSLHDAARFPSVRRCELVNRAGIIFTLGLIHLVYTFLGSKGIRSPGGVVGRQRRSHRVDIRPLPVALAVHGSDLLATLPDDVLRRRGEAILRQIATEAGQCSLGHPIALRIVQIARSSQNKA